MLGLAVAQGRQQVLAGQHGAARVHQFTQQGERTRGEPHRFVRVPRQVDLRAADLEGSEPGVQSQDLLLLQVVAHQADHGPEPPPGGDQRLQPGLVQRPGGDLPDDGGRHLRAQRLEQAVQPAVLLGHGQEGLDRGSRREGEHLELALDHGVHHP